MIPVKRVVRDVLFALAAGMLVVVAASTAMGSADLTTKKKGKDFLSGKSPMTCLTG